MPLAAINHLSPSQVEAILLHELSHIRRFDYLVNFIINVIRVVLYFNPFAKAFVRIVETEREKSCDEMVLQFQYDTHDYASALLTLEKVSRQNKILVLAAAGHREDLLCRVETMLGMRKNTFNVRQLLAVMAGIICVLSVNALLLISKPSGAIAKNKKFSGLEQGVDGRDMAALIEKPEQLINHISKTPAAPPKAAAAPAIAQATPKNLHNAAIIAANFELPPPVVTLDAEKEAQVKEAMEASKRVIENMQWKQVEKNLADVFNENEKAKMKNEWQKEINSKMNWENWENKLRQAYDQVDWEKVNLQLNNAIKQIQVDSLMTVYNNTMVTLRGVQRQLNNDSLKGIPDTDITLKEIADKQRLVQKALLDLRKVKARKIVRL
jgi:hypothetical protein